jgi:SWI/SNF-related matrix-associated actin-dependent regulator 1 of chromatin subfamily A
LTYITHDKNFVYFTAKAFEAAQLGAVKVQKYRGYKLPINRHTIKTLQQHISHDTLANLLAREEAVHTQMKFLKDTPAPPSDILRPYQAKDVQIIARNPRLAIFNEQRTGKTPTILNALKNETNGIIVCPSSLKLNWHNEAKVWANTPTVVISGTKQRRIKLYGSIDTENIIISYETLRADFDTIVKMFKSFNFLVVDEAHRLRNYKTKQSKAVLGIGSLSKRVYPMTGTPAVNHPADVFGILKLLFPQTYTSYWNFIERYFGFYETPFGRKLGKLREDRKDEFHSLLYNHSLQRKRRDVMAWIPKVDFHTIELEPSSKQLTLFNEIVRKHTLLGEQIPNAITKLTRLRQVCVDPNYFGVDHKSPKVAFIMDYIEDNPHETIIIFSTMTQALNRLKAAIPDSVILTGEQSTVEKQWAVDQIQSGNARVLLANIKAGGTGFTLDKADTIIFLDKSYTPDENQQAADRFVPTNPDAEYGAKQVLTLVVNGSVEPKIEKLLDQKINIISYVNDYGLEGIFDL